MKKYIFWVMGLLSQLAVAQTVTVSDPEKTRDLYSDQVVLGGDANTVFTARMDNYLEGGFYNRKIELASFGTDLKKRTSAKVKPGTDGADFIHFAYFGGRVVAFSIAPGKEGSMYDVYAEAFGEDLTPAGAPRKVGAVQAFLFTYSPAVLLTGYYTGAYRRLQQHRFAELVTSADGSHLGLVFNYNLYAGYEKRLHCVVIKSDLTTLWEAPVELPTDERYFLREQTVLTNGGDLYFCAYQSATSDFSRRQDSFDYLVAGYDRSTKKTVAYELGNDRFLSNVGIGFDEAKQELVAVALAADATAKTLNGAGTFRFRPGQSKPRQRVFTDFEAAFAQQLSQSDKEKKRFDDYQFRQVRCQPDGRLWVAVESYRRGAIVDASAALRGAMLGGSVSPTVRLGNIYEDILLLGFDPAGQPAWQHVVDKRQQTDEDPDIFTSYAFAEHAGQGFLLYNEKVRTTANIELTTVAAAGTVSTQTLLPANKGKSLLIPGYAATLTNGDWVLPARRFGRNVLVKVVFP